jgi:hypothetical protein
VLSEDISLGDPLKLAFAEHVHVVIAWDGALRRGKCRKPQPRTHAACHQLMILFHHIIQIWAWSEPTSLWKGVLVLEGLEGW